MSWLSKLLGRPGDTSGVATPPGPVGPRVDLLLGDPLAREWHDWLARGDWAEFGDFLRAQDDIEVRDLPPRSAELVATRRPIRVSRPFGKLGRPSYLDEGTGAQRSPAALLEMSFPSLHRRCFAGPGACVCV